MGYNSKKYKMYIKETILNLQACNNYTPKECKNALDSNNIKCSYQRVLSLYKELNLNLEGSGGKLKIINHNPFIVNESNSSYWLGYIAADGNVASKGNNITVVSKDINHLEKYRLFLSENLKMYKFTNKQDSRLGVIYFGNPDVKQWLISKGITPKKSISLKVDYELINWDFVRGVFDGDGTIGPQAKITSGSMLFIKQLQTFLATYDIYTYIKPKNRECSCYDLIILNRDKYKFYFHLYKKAEIFLERKKDKYGAFLRNKLRKKNVNSVKAVMLIPSQAI